MTLAPPPPNYPTVNSGSMRPGLVDDDVLNTVGNLVQDVIVFRLLHALVLLAAVVVVERLLRTGGAFRRLVAACGVVFAVAVVLLTGVPTTPSLFTELPEPGRAVRVGHAPARRWGRRTC